jgi:TPR repeat protein
VVTCRRTTTRPRAFTKLAADQGNAFGQVNLAVLYRDGRGGLPKDEREAARLFKLSAD